jgi:hypothetical protein
MFDGSGATISGKDTDLRGKGLQRIARPFEKYNQFSSTLLLLLLLLLLL